MDAKQTELEQAQRKGDLERAARIRYGDMRELEANSRTPRKRCPSRRPAAMRL